MATIRVLPQQLINQIAAGEVVVNMASVVKELVENSIDAGATLIRLSLSQNLQDLTIEDDGCGMNEDDAELCLQRHATSKIRSTEDLFHLRTRGFRGEAIPSIASVSRMEIQTRPRSQSAGTRIVVEGGAIHKIEPIGCPVGTRFIIRDLFYNTPARRKFLKSTVAELNTIMKTVVRQALASPEVGLRVERERELILELPSGQSLADRFQSLQGSRVEHGLIPLDFARLSRAMEEPDQQTPPSPKEHPDQLIRITGYIAHPQSTRGDRSAQYLFVNRRPFSQKQISASIEQACRGFVMTGRFPVYCLFIEVPPEEVDFNVHPTKEEVRFRDERAIAGAAYHAVKLALESASLVPELHLSPSAPVNDPSPLRFEDSPRAAVQRALERKSSESSSVPIPRTGTQSDLTLELMKQKQQPWWLDYPVQPESPPQMAQPQQPESESPQVSDPLRDLLAQSAAVPRPREGIRKVSPYASPGEKPEPAFWERPYEPEPLGQLALTYILVRFGNDLLIVDQHAAHERIRFLELQSRLGRVESQTLLVPETFEVSGEQAALLRTLQTEFQSLGLSLEHFGGSTWAIYSVPADFKRFDPVAVVLDVLDDFELQGRSSRMGNLRDQLLIRMACHSSIRAGHQLTHPEMRALLELMQRHRLSFTCPHGRPTIILLSQAELEKRFGRLGS
ncbi:MAG: DNA mismatch repair endonuclease MutL [Candidatus Sumerlaeia bacterium]|nr:DNA mismatch repair endonuclease MutL [Candidatus Sumerlaeia bacterium]